MLSIALAATWVVLMFSSFMTLLTGDLFFIYKVQEYPERFILSISQFVCSFIALYGSYYYANENYEY